MPLIKQKPLVELQHQVNKFNQRFPVGSSVIVKLDGGNNKLCKVKAPAEVLGGHSAVGYFNEITGCYSLDRII